MGVSEPAAEELTIDELAHRTGVPSSTIRLYHTRGVLPKPRREGRVGRYGPHHVARLRLVSTLQERGFSLAAIGELVSSWEGGRTLDEVLGLERGAADAFPAEEPVDLTAEELLQVFDGAAIDAADVQSALEHGFAKVLPDGRLRVRSRAFLEVGRELVALGVPVAAVFEEQVRLQSALDETARRFAALFERHVWQPFVDAGMPAEQMPQVRAALDRLGPLARRIVQSDLDEALRNVAEQFLEAEARRLSS